MEEKCKRASYVILLILTLMLMAGMDVVCTKFEGFYLFKQTFYYIVYAKTSAEDVNDYLTFDLPMNVSESLVRQLVYLRNVTGDFKILRKNDRIMLGLPLNKTGGAEGVAFVVVKVAYNYTGGGTPTIPSLDDYVLKSSIPREFIEKYVREPDEAIKSIEDEVDVYLKRHNVNMENIVKVAYWVAKYIMENFEYQTSGKPRPLKEVVARRVGDCDDLSELYVNLMWRYGIPAQLGSVAIFLYGRRDYIDMGVSKVICENVGYHAYALVYMPKWGWVPVDITFNKDENPFYASRYVTLGDVIIFGRFMARNITAYNEFKSFMEKHKTIIVEAYYDEEQKALRRWRDLLGLPASEIPEKSKEVVQINVKSRGNVTIVQKGGVIPKISENTKSKVEVIIREVDVLKVYLLGMGIFLGLTALSIYLVVRRLKKLERSVQEALETLRKDFEGRWKIKGDSVSVG